MITITIGIAAYNAEQNIGTLLDALCTQQSKHISISDIFVYSDGSSDKTVEIARAKKDKRIRVIENKKRHGFGESVYQLLTHSTGDIIVLLNDDIRIDDKNFLQKIAHSFSYPNIGLVSGNPIPLSPETFIEKAAVSTYRIYEQTRYKVKNGNNIWTCDGKVLVLSRKFARSLLQKKSFQPVGNIDAYLYFECISRGFLYQHVREAVVWFRCPSTYKEYFSWMIRNNSDSYLLTDKFSQRIKKEFALPKHHLLYFALKEFIHNPQGFFFMLPASLYIRYTAQHASTQFTSTWNSLRTTKKLS
jgi:glycosyltransferase involved in cell wall biosynthesis